MCSSDLSKLSVADVEFGYSVAVSKNERWMYIGAPGINTVYAYGRVDWTAQTMSVTPTAPLASLYIADDIQINNANQLNVYVNSGLLTLGVDYTVSLDLTTILFTGTIPTSGDYVNVQQASSVTLFGDGSTTSYNVSQYLFKIGRAHV